MSNVIQFPGNHVKESNKNRKKEGLFIDEVNGTLQGSSVSSSNFRRPESEDFGDRMQRIKRSLEQINALMTELKKTSKHRGV